MEKNINKTTDSDLKREISLYKREINKDMVEVNVDKKKFINEIVTGGLGQRLNDYNSYHKKSPSKWKIFLTKLKHILWNV
jgi:hypothetical protein